ncbi:hypothetical protein BG842_00690 [Haladaptatus sp. W1]|uniref:HalOD1 output domain-containing protein n=1 Tax=Haladaptatus sp. W1 TaxID=1897478 RepID=UPI0008497F63|nr:HalOD1 output domain-containing protein [Haladaptatus sp. W1]ODR80951.1 hypothetical protein BG842_00690 [Haladaptatus sp. W1]
MSSNPASVETTHWFENESTSADPTNPPQYVLIATWSVDPDQSLTVSLIETIVDTLKPPDGQTSLSLYQHVNPDALEEIIEASTTKESGVEVRFTIEDYLVTVRSNDTVLIYEPLGPHRSSSRNPIHN